MPHLRICSGAIFETPPRLRGLPDLRRNHSSPSCEAAPLAGGRGPFGWRVPGSGLRRSRSAFRDPCGPSMIRSPLAPAMARWPGAPGGGHRDPAKTSDVHCRRRATHPAAAVRHTAAKTALVGLRSWLEAPGSGKAPRIPILRLTSASLPARDFTRTHTHEEALDRVRRRRHVSLYPSTWCAVRPAAAKPLPPRTTLRIPTQRTPMWRVEQDESGTKRLARRAVRDR